MKIFTRTREALTRRFVRRKLKGLVRNRKVNNFSSAKSIGLYFETKNPEDFKIIWDFSKNLEKRNIKTSILGYVEAEHIPSEMTIRDNCIIILPKDLDWLYRPKLENVDHFIEEEFDILLDLSLTDRIQGYYIQSLSRANFKVGRYRESSNDIDLMINIDQERSVDFLLKQIETYVSIINN